MCHMSDKTSSRFSLDMLNLAGYFIVPAVAIPMLWDLFQNDSPSRWLASGLVALFTVVFSLRQRIVGDRPWGPYLYTGLQTAIIVGLLVLSPHQLIAVVLFFVLSAEVTMMYPPRVIAAWIALFTLITLVAYVAVSGPSGMFAVPIYAAGYVFFAIFAQQTAKAETARADSERLLVELQEAHSQLQAYASQAEDLAVQQERNRLAREMHDTLGHRLTVSSVQLQAAQRLIPSAPDRAAQMVGAVLEEIREGLGELRRTVATLRAPVEADLALGPALKRLACGFEQATGIAVHLKRARRSARAGPQPASRALPRCSGGLDQHPEARQRARCLDRAGPVQRRGSAAGARQRRRPAPTARPALVCTACASEPLSLAAS